MFSLEEITKITQGQLQGNAKQIIKSISLDSRQIIPSQSVFIAIKGQRFDGHDFIEEATHKGAKFFIVQKDWQSPLLNRRDLHFIFVEDTLRAMQELAKAYREQFDIPIVGITGSFGKTMVKEWLFQLLSPDYTIAKSPKSYNSQVGVPLSIFGLRPQHNLAIFEAGISQTGEMVHLANQILPTIGIYTGIGAAHDAGFASQKEKLEEKLNLFEEAEVIISEDIPEIRQALEQRFAHRQLLFWKVENNQLVSPSISLPLPHQKNPYFEKNIGSAVVLMKYLGYSKEDIEKRLLQVEQLPMRFEIIEGKNNSLIINDSYSNDIAGIEQLLKTSQEIAPNQPIDLFITDFDQSKLSNKRILDELSKLFQQYKVRHLVAIGDLFVKNPNSFDDIVDVPITVPQVSDLNQYIEDMNPSGLLLFKGSRKHKLEQLVQKLRKYSHDAELQINLSHIIQNINVFRSRLEKEVKLMIMLKATGYGAKVDKLAQLLSYQKVDYLGVAYPEEGRDLRQQGVDLPIFVMNTSERNFAMIVKYNLEIELFSLEQAAAFLTYLTERNIKHYPVHIKLDTGMHRLGFAEEDLDQLIQLITTHKQSIAIKGILSHLSCADDLEQENITRQQIKHFDQLSQRLLPLAQADCLRHILNTAGLSSPLDLPQFDMVRIGIGLHGFAPFDTVQEQLTQIETLTARIAQVKEVKKGEYVSYGCEAKAAKNMKIAILSLGYADGYDRRFGNGTGQVLIHNQLCPVIGAVCMDMFMVDVSNIGDVQEGERAILTSPRLCLKNMAHKIGTITYELLTSISSRVNRSFIYE